jgi:hypothetical protein
MVVVDILPEKATLHINGHLVVVNGTSLHLTHVKNDSAFVETISHEGVTTTLGSEFDPILVGKCDGGLDILDRPSLHDDSWVGVAIVQVADEYYAILVDEPDYTGDTYWLWNTLQFPAGGLDPRIAAPLECSNWAHLQGLA